MLNRFEKCKNLEDLYVVFMGDEYTNYDDLSDIELERIAVVFEANLPRAAVLPVTPLNEKGFEYIFNVVFEEVETAPIPDEPVEETEVYFDNEIMEDEVMNETINNETVNNVNVEEETMSETINNETAATAEEVTMGQKAKEFAETAKDKLAEGFKFATGNIDSVADEVKKMANMNDVQLEKHLTEKGKEILDKIVKGIKSFANKSKEDGKKFPFFADVANENAAKADNIVELIKATLDEEELSGWGKFKAIVKELVKWLLRLLLKVGAIVLKLALTVAVGTIKIGATAIVTTGKVIGVLNKEVVKPTVKAGKNAWATHKANKVEKAKATVKEAEEEEFEEVREALFGVDEEDYEDAE